MNKYYPLISYAAPVLLNLYFTPNFRFYLCTPWLPVQQSNAALPTFRKEMVVAWAKVTERAEMWSVKVGRRWEDVT